MCERVVVLKSSTRLPDEEKWKTGYGTVSKMTEKERFDTHWITVTVIICPYKSPAAFGVESAFGIEIEYGATRRRGIEHRL